jgi:predicted RNase H-like HicB family nuclease
MQHTYRMILMWNEQSHYWIVTIPELPGAMADGATPEEAVKQAQEVIRLWIETAQETGHPVPPPVHWQGEVNVG